MKKEKIEKDSDDFLLRHMWAKVFLILYPPFENSITRTAICNMYPSIVSTLLEESWLFPGWFAPKL